MPDRIDPIRPVTTVMARPIPDALLPKSNGAKNGYIVTAKAFVEPNKSVISKKSRT